jgi:FKBP-type peptidyl-prolyl cis-trans isomerase
VTRIVLAVVAASLLAGCGAQVGGDGSRFSVTPAPDLCAAPPTPSPGPDGDSFCARPASVNIVPDGLQWGDFTGGTGPAITAGQRIRVQYTGWLQSTGAMFDSSRQPGRQPFEFTLGGGAVIAGWEQGLRGIHVGGKRRLVVPPSLGYGAAGRPPAIPANATLIFDVEVLAAS